MKIISMIIITCMFLFLVSCQKEKQRKVSDFEFLKVGDLRTEILDKFGEPDDNIGSGLHIYVYNIEDEKNIVLNFSADDKLTKITLKSQDGIEKINLE